MSEHPLIHGLFETHINVSELERSMAFYGDVLELELALLQKERGVAFYWMGGRGESMIGLWEKPTPIERQHFAFRSSVEAILKHSVTYLHERGLATRDFDNQSQEPFVFGWMPALSIYFRDPDGHSLELIAMLPDAPRPDIIRPTWEKWQQLVAEEK